MENKHEEMLRRRQEVEYQKELNSKPISSKAREYFLSPASLCQFCGQAIEDKEDVKQNYWQRKWSIHWECRLNVEDQLDRATGIKSERKVKK